MSRKGSTDDSRDKEAQKVHNSQRVSPQIKKNKPPMNYTPGSNSFKFNNMMKDMGITFNYNNFQPTRVENRQKEEQEDPTKKLSMIDNLMGGYSNKGSERMHKMYSATNIHSKGLAYENPFQSENEVRSSEIFMMGTNNNHHQHFYKLSQTGRGKTPHQEPGIAKQRKEKEGRKRSNSRPKSSKYPGEKKEASYNSEFFYPNKY